MSELPISNVRIIAQQDPVPTMTARFGVAVATAGKQVANLTDTLREIDKIAGQLHERGITVNVELGPVGDTAAAARRDMERETGNTFEMPRNPE